MKNTKKSMTKIEAIKAIANLGTGMYARIFGSDKYSIIDDGISSMITTAASMDEEAFAECENWHDVLVAVNAHHEKQNYYINGNEDFREYHIKYGYDEAVTILRNYIETVTQEGIADTKTERDYIRGAKDALCIA
ncbi:MAG: hypothetical protein IIY21_05725 [Clostridiales bacterium]|nr:hypothetical protein [Clostridiales bacterium]